MEASKSIVSLYNILSKVSTQLDVKNTIADTIFIVLDDLANEGLPVTEENVNARLKKFADDFTEASKTDVA